jgi:hypothetical protein
MSQKHICRTFFLVLSAALLLLSVISFYFYLDLKKNLISRVSEKTASAIDQQVEIGDIDFDFASGITIENVRIRNPEGFPSGQLLGIEKIVLLPVYRELLKGRFHFASITLHSPALTIFENTDGRINISDEFRRRLSEKGTAEYRIDEFRILSGVAAFNDDIRYRLERVNLAIKNLSSMRDTKTSLAGDFYWAGDNKATLEGWANLQDGPRQFSISMATGEIRLSSFRESLVKYNIDPEKTILKIHLDLSGDMEQGARIRSGIQVTSPGHELYRKGPIGLAFDADAHYGISDRSITINNLTLRSEDDSEVNLKGKINNFPKEPAYNFDVQIGRLDLSNFNFFQGFSASGVLNSDLIKVKGRLDSLPELDGSLQLTKGSMKSAGLELRNTNGEILFLPGRMPAARAEITLDILKAAKYPFSGPAAVKISIQAGQSEKGLALSSTLSSSPAAVRISEKSDFSLKDAHIEIDGVLREALFSGKSTVKARGLRYDSSSFERFTSVFGFSYREGDFTIKNPMIETEVFSSSADFVKLDTGANGNFSINAGNVNAAHPGMKAAFRGADFNANLHMPDKEISGSVNFKIAGASFENLKAGRISGRSKFSSGGFTLDIPDADFSGGKLTLAADGRTTQGPFPVKLNMTAENLDLGAMLSSGRIMPDSYRVSGDLKKVFFSGTLTSVEVIHGEMKLELERFSVLNEKTKLHLIKDLSVSPLITLKGKDSDFRADISAGNIIMPVSGTVRNFLSERRELVLRAKLNETPLNEIRNALWDSFPDKLLYAGLEGSAASEFVIRYNRSGTAYEGNMNLKNVTIEGENGEYLIGPVNGKIPFVYGNTDVMHTEISLPSFEKSDFETTSRHYAETTPGGELNRISIGDIRYGFRLLTDLTVWIKQDGGVLNISRFSANIFGGKLNGSAVIDLSDGLQYRGGMILEGVSLTTLGNEIEPVKGYISGRINGIGLIKGAKGGLSELIGRADFWTYATRDEKMRISREFLQKIGGPSIKPYLADRNFDKGVMGLYMQKGFFIFRELEISNRNMLGIQDLSVKVAPLSNRIAIDHLMWTIIEAAERAKQNGG